LFFSAKCGLSCTYCYIGKEKSTAKINNTITEEFRDGGISRVLLENYGKDVSSLSLWGAEPTENMDLFIDQIDEILDTFPKLKTISASSNFFKKKSPDSLVELIKKISTIIQPDRELNLSFQCSLDGPPWSSDHSRQTATGRGVTSIIAKNTHSFIKEASSLDIPKNMMVRLAFKSTVDIPIMRSMVDNDDLFYDYWVFFDQFGEHQNKENKQFRVYLESCVPTTILPGTYTSEDSIYWSKYLKKCVDHSRQQNPYKYLDNTKLIPYLSSFERVISDSEQKRTQNHGYACGASGFGFSLGTERRAHICHRSYFFEDEGYVKLSALTKDKYENGREKIFMKKFMSKRSDEEEFYRQQYVSYGFRDFFQTKYSYVMTTLYHLARCGQADKDYLWDEDYRKLTALFIAGASNCIMEGYFTSGSFHLPPQETIKVWSGGAIKILCNEYIRRLKERECVGS